MTERPFHFVTGLDDTSYTCHCPRGRDHRVADDNADVLAALRSHDGTRAASVALLSGLSREELDAVGGVPDSAALDALAAAVPDLLGQLARLRAQIVELLPYAAAGADALDFQEPYGFPVPGVDADYDVIRDGPAREMMARIKAGEFTS